MLVVFWGLFQTGQEWVAAAFYLLGLIFAILLVSQFWSLANATRSQTGQAPLWIHRRRHGARGGRRGHHLVGRRNLGTNSLLLVSAAALALCIVIVVLVLGRERHAVAGPGGEEGWEVSGRAKRWAPVHLETGATDRRRD